MDKTEILLTILMKADEPWQMHGRFPVSAVDANPLALKGLLEYWMDDLGFVQQRVTQKGLDFLKGARHG